MAFKVMDQGETVTLFNDILIMAPLTRIEYVLSMPVPLYVVTYPHIIRTIQCIHSFYGHLLFYIWFKSYSPPHCKTKL
jgi:hypothetical protein